MIKRLTAAICLMARKEDKDLLDSIDEAAHGWRRRCAGRYYLDPPAERSVRLRAAGGFSRLYIINLPIYMPSSDHFAL